MKKRTIKIEYIIEVQYDEESEEFQSALESYREVLDSDGDADDLVLNAVCQAQRRGRYSMLEGVGYVKVNGHVEDESMYCGIEIDDDDPAPDVEFL